MRATESDSLDSIWSNLTLVWGLQLGKFWLSLGFWVIRKVAFQAKNGIIGSKNRESDETRNRSACVRGKNSKLGAKNNISDTAPILIKKYFSSTQDGGFSTFSERERPLWN